MTAVITPPPEGGDAGGELPFDGSRHPVDVRLLIRGQDIPAHELERIVGLPRTDKKYAFELLWICGHIRDESLTIGTPLSPVVRGDLIHINTHAEAAVYHQDQLERGERKMFRHARDLSVRVDASQLTAEQQHEHQRNVLVASHKVMGLLNARSRGIAGGGEGNLITA